MQVCRGSKGIIHPSMQMTWQVKQVYPTLAWQPLNRKKWGIILFDLSAAGAGAATAALSKNYSPAATTHAGYYNQSAKRLAQGLQIFWPWLLSSRTFRPVLCLFGLALILGNFLGYPAFTYRYLTLMNITYARYHHLAGVYYHASLYTRNIFFFLPEANFGTLTLRAHTTYCIPCNVATLQSYRICSYYVRILKRGWGSAVNVEPFRFYVLTFMRNLPQ